MSENEIYLFGEVLFDCFPDTQPVLGGAPFNVAWHLRAFGENPQLISAVGNDELGEKIKFAMDQWQLSREFLQVDTYHPTGVVSISINDGEPSYQIEQNRAYDFIDVQRLPPVQEPAIFYHGSLAARNEVSKQCLQALQEKKRLNRFVDVNLRSPWWRRDEVIATLNCAYCVKLNGDELTLLTQQQDLNLSKRHDVLAIAKEFKQKNNIVNLLLTLGEQGATLMDANGDIYCANVTPPSKPIVDTVGAGDAFAAVTILGIQQHWDWGTTLERAQQFASFIVTQRGATCSNAGVYRDFINFWNVL